MHNTKITVHLILVLNDCFRFYYCHTLKSLNVTKWPNSGFQNLVGFVSEQMAVCN
ncbi:hypothetical protein B0F87_1047 [Methylobacter tundripaludum]|uniref:Uncharacterized protein n=1 Tax=Methylobacter tundripaludum TaxID=173365 RepID=A0A2S6HEQ6_9GAMM|nr:hypothetical protein B0F87_1047 [Methylobacter tundripaludum]